MQDAEMQDIDLLHDSKPFKFSSDIMDSLSSPKQRSFTVREARDDGYNSKKNSHFSHHNDNEWDGMLFFFFFLIPQTNISTILLWILYFKRAETT